jgi:hypothetical protein
MKAILNKFLVFIFFLFGILNGMAKATPPSPNGRTSDTPPPPGLPIDESLFYLIILAVIFGIYITYSRKLNPKTSI